MLEAEKQKWLISGFRALADGMLSGWMAQGLTSPPLNSTPRRGMSRPRRASQGGGSKVWALIVSANSNSRVNSRLLPAGLCVLADRDEIRFGGEVQYFSTETLAAAVDFPGADRPVFCGRCRQQIDAGTPAVCCPGCGIWYNQSGELPQSSVFLTATGPSSS